MKKRSECNCQCHVNKYYRHITACCRPDDAKPHSLDSFMGLEKFLEATWNDHTA